MNSFNPTLEQSPSENNNHELFSFPDTLPSEFPRLNSSYPEGLFHHGCKIRNKEEYDRIYALFTRGRKTAKQQREIKRLWMRASKKFFAKMKKDKVPMKDFDEYAHEYIISMIRGEKRREAGERTKNSKAQRGKKAKRAVRTKKSKASSNTIPLPPLSTIFGDSVQQYSAPGYNYFPAATENQCPEGLVSNTHLLPLSTCFDHTQLTYSAPKYNYFPITVKQQYQTSSMSGEPSIPPRNINPLPPLTAEQWINSVYATPGSLYPGPGILTTPSNKPLSTVYDSSQTSGSEYNYFPAAPEQYSQQSSPQMHDSNDHPSTSH